MNAPKSIAHTAPAKLVTAECIFAQNFRIATNTPVPGKNNFQNLGAASDSANGFSVTWIKDHEADCVFFKGTVPAAC